MSDAAWVGLAVTVGASIVGGVWRAAVAMTRMSVAVDRLRDDVADISESVRGLPVITERIAHVEGFTRSAISEISELQQTTARHGAQIERLCQ